MSAPVADPVLEAVRKYFAAGPDASAVEHLIGVLDRLSASPDALPLRRLNLFIQRPKLSGAGPTAAAVGAAALALLHAVGFVEDSAKVWTVREADAPIAPVSHALELLRKGPAALPSAAKAGAVTDTKAVAVAAAPVAPPAPAALLSDADRWRRIVDRNRRLLHSPAADKQFRCTICLSDYTADDLFALDCGHFLCQNVRFPATTLTTRGCASSLFVPHASRSASPLTRSPG
jgi:hypothetical protein